jgi:hypothetical protein
MAHATTHSYDFTPEEALREIKSERTRRAWIALFLFILSGAAIATSFYLSYRDIPAPPSPANNAPGLLDPYH